MEAVKTVIITGGGGISDRPWRAGGRSPAHNSSWSIAMRKGWTNALRPLAAWRGPLVATDVATADDLKAAAASLPQSLWQSPPSLVLVHALSGKDSGPKSARLGDLDRNRWQDVVDVNLTSVVFAIEVFLPFMRRAGGGRIVLVSSTAGLSASPTAALSYAVTKATIAALPRLLAPELASSKVLINAVAPGKFVNPDWPDDPNKVKRYERSVPLGRLASADEVAALIGFLSSSANTYVTGQTIVQDGGRLSSLPTIDQW